MLLCPWNFPGKNTGVGSHSLLQRIFLTQNPGLLYCRQILYYLFTREAPMKPLSHEDVYAPINSRVSSCNAKLPLPSSQVFTHPRLPSNK